MRMLQKHIVNNKRAGAIKLPALYGPKGPNGLMGPKVMVKPGRSTIEYDFDAFRKDPKKVAIMDVFDAHCEVATSRPAKKNTSRSKDNIFADTEVEDAIVAICEMSVDECKKCLVMDNRREINQALNERIRELEDAAGKTQHFGAPG